MIIKIYRKHTIGNKEIEENEMYISFPGVTNIQVINGILYGNMSGEQLTINCDNRNFNYYIEDEKSLF